MKAPECKYKETEMDLAKYADPDVGFEDHGIFAMFGQFDYLDCGCQGLGYCIDLDFLEKFIRVFGVCSLHKCTELVWVEHNRMKIFRIISVDGEKEFDIGKWTEECRKKEE